MFQTGGGACHVFAIVNDRKLPLAEPMTAEEGREAAGFLFHCKDEGSSQTSYRRGSFQGFSIRAGGQVPLPAGISALRCQRGPHEPDGDHLFARMFYADRLDAGMTLERLGFSATEAALFAGIRMAPHGGVFIGGTAGDGKSTTLAVNLALQMAEFDGQLNLVTIEDPVEYRIPGAVQIAVPTSGLGDERAGHFKEALMHFCRIHPASGMVSEIRDADAARQVMQFIDTGHQVWTTIHVHSANAILFRLIDMGVGVAEVTKPGNVALLMKQTLLPLLCPDCALEPARRGTGCTGKSGRSPARQRCGALPQPEGLSPVPARGWRRCRGAGLERLHRTDGDRRDHPARRRLSRLRARLRSLGRLGLLAPGDGRRADRRQDLEAGGRGRRRSVRRPAQGRRHRARGGGEPHRGRGGGPMMGSFRIGVFWRRAFAARVLGRKARVDCFRTVADLLESGFELERALDVTVRAQRGQGPSLRAGLLEGWRRALIENRFAEAMAASAPPAEAMIFQAYGRIEAALLFAAAARVADFARPADLGRVRKALAMPLTLAPVSPSCCGRRAGISCRYWKASCRPNAGDRPPVCSAPPRLGSMPNRLYFAPSAPPSCRNRHGDGPLDRSRPDRARPHRPVLALPHDHRLGLPVRGARVSRRRSRSQRPRFRGSEAACLALRAHRIGAIQRGMARGAGLGRAMALAGHGFPDPALVPVAAALDGAPGWEDKLARFVERWVGRSEDLLKARAAALNGALLIVVTLAMAAGIDAMFSVLQQAGRS